MACPICCDMLVVYTEDTKGNYLDIDGGLEGRLLRIVTFQPDAVLVVPDGVSRDGWMMTARIALALSYYTRGMLTTG